MTNEKFKAIIEFYGEDSILGFGFDNSAGITFDGTNRFSLSNHYKEEIECLTFVNFDRKGNPYHIVKHIENIQAIYVKDKAFSMDVYDRVSIRG